jgi:4-hydroxybenzoate polyprenyltransferase
VKAPYLFEQYIQPKSGNWGDYLALLRLDKPVGALLLLWPTLWALMLASDGSPSWANFLIFTLGVFAMRSAGCVMNDYADREFDPKVKRTTQRPLASGRLSKANALAALCALLVLSVILVLLTNWLTIQLAVVALLLAAGYPYAKRHTHLAQVVLGAAFSWGIPMAFAAETNSLPPQLWLLLIANLIWVVVYDTYYAMVDRDDDLKIGVKSTAILFAENDRIIIGSLQVLLVLSLFMVGGRFELGGIYTGGVIICAGLFCYQQWLTRDRGRRECFQAFVNNQWVGLILFLAIGLDLLFK